MIKKKSGQYCVYSKDGKRSFGCYDTKGEAEKRLGQIEYFKMNKQLLHFNQTVTADMVTRKKVDGANCIVIKSATLPDNVVMNGILYSAEEIDKSFASLERVLSPVGHPMKDGKFISATDPFAVNNFHVGAYVANVRRANGKVYHDTIINIDVASQSDKGRELLEAVENMEKTGEPIHTSTGVLLKRIPVSPPAISVNGQEYDGIAQDMVFDHNAILINQPGAATPEQGVGMMVNSDQVDFDTFVSNEDYDESLDDMMRELRDMLRDAIAKTEPSAKWLYISDIYDRQVVYEVEREDNTNDCYRVDWGLIDGEVVLGEQKENVVRKTWWKVVANNALSFIKNMSFANGNHEDYNPNVNKNSEEIEMTPEELKAALAANNATLQADFKASLDGVVKPLQEKIDKLEANAANAEKAKREKLEAVAKAKGVSDETIAGMTTNALEEIYGSKQDGQPASFAAGGELKGNSGDNFLDMEAPE